MSTFTFLMPDIGEGVVEGEIVSWLKNEGDLLKKDESVLILMTDKATVELPTPRAGKLSKQYYKSGDIAKKGTPLFDVAETSKEQKPLAAPTVRKLAKDQGISLEQIQGTGLDGRILKQDLSKLNSSGDTETRVTGIKRLMVKKMEESHAHIPSFSYFEAGLATRLVQLREKMAPEALKIGIALTFMPFFIKALSLTLSKYPIANSSYDERKESLITHASHNIGIAMKTPLGLIVPVLKGVEKMSLIELVKEYNELKKRAINNKLNPLEMKDGTITLTNFGALSQGADHATPIINYPEVAILGVARIHKEPVVQNDALAIAEMLHCSWSFDHRVIDGEAAAAISQNFLKLIENPALLI